MLLYFTQQLTELYAGFRLFNYLTFRAILGALTALVLSFLIGPWMIRTFTEKQIAECLKPH